MCHTLGTLLIYLRVVIRDDIHTFFREKTLLLREGVLRKLGAIIWST